MKKITTYLSIFILLLALGACGSDNATGPDPDPDPNPDQLTQQQNDALSYFKDLVLGVERGDPNDITRRWERELQIFIEGDVRTEISNELNAAITEINELIDGSNLNISFTTTNRSAANGYIFFGTAEEYVERDPTFERFVRGGASEFFIQEFENHELARMTGYVDRVAAGSLQRGLSLLRVVVARGIGFPNVSQRNVLSIFNTVNGDLPSIYTEIDRWMIELLYHPQMRSGLDESQLDEVLEEIVTDVVPR